MSFVQNRVCFNQLTIHLSFLFQNLSASTLFILLYSYVPFRDGVCPY